MKARDPDQAEFGIVWKQPGTPFRLRAGDVIRIARKLGRVMRVNDCSAVVIINKPERVFKTRFDKAVQFQPSPGTVRISPHSEVQVLNRKSR